MEKISEAQIEKKVTQYAKRAGWLSYKWVSPSQRWVPDRLYFKDGEVKMVEFKAPGSFPRGDGRLSTRCSAGKDAPFTLLTPLKKE